MTYNQWKINEKMRLLFRYSLEYARRIFVSMDMNVLAGITGVSAIDFNALAPGYKLSEMPFSGFSLWVWLNDTAPGQALSNECRTMPCLCTHQGLRSSLDNI